MIDHSHTHEPRECDICRQVHAGPFPLPESLRNALNGLRNDREGNWGAKLDTTPPYFTDAEVRDLIALIRVARDNARRNAKLLRPNLRPGGRLDTNLSNAITRIETLDAKVQALSTGSPLFRAPF